ncbi:hypothetical protein STEG23_022958 [Scotinomys teguina]
MAAAVCVSRVSVLLGWTLFPRVWWSMSSDAHREEGSVRMRKALTYFVALPGVRGSMLNIFLKSQHEEHERLEFVAYPHLRHQDQALPLGRWVSRIYGNTYASTDAVKVSSHPAIHILEIQKGNGVFFFFLFQAKVDLSEFYFLTDMHSSI